MSSVATLDDLLDAKQVQALRRHWITTVDDLYSALEEDQPAVARLLDLSDEQADRLREEARQASSPEVRIALAREARTPRQFGAWIPED